MASRAHAEADANAVARIVAEHLPSYAGRAVAPLGEGLDHAAFLVGGELVVRFGEAPQRAEARLLELAARACPVAVPEPFAAGDDWLAYRLLEGVALLDVCEERRAVRARELGDALGAVIAALRAVAPDEAAEVAEPDPAPPAEWRDAAAEALAEAAGALEAPLRRAAERFLAEPLPAAAPDLALCHHDLGSEHVLVDADTLTVTGVIDWGDAALADPARDLGLVLRDLGPEALDAALRRCPPGDDAGLPQRAAFHARWAALEDLAFGLRTGDERYERAARRALGRLLAA